MFRCSCSRCALHCRYLHVVEPRQNVDLGLGVDSDNTATVWPFRRAWKGVFISAGGHDFVRTLALTQWSQLCGSQTTNADISPLFSGLLVPLQVIA